MKEARESQASFTAEKDNMFVCCLEGFKLQVIFKPEPAEHLDDQGWSEHEAEQQAEPEEIPLAEKLLREPEVRAHIEHICTHTDHREGEIQPRVLGEHVVVHGKDVQQFNPVCSRYILSYILLQDP